MNHRSYWLELDAVDEFRPKPWSAEAGISLAKLSGTDVARARQMWTDVGWGFWSERDDWPDARWCDHLRSAGVEFWVARRAVDDLGFFELTSAGDGVKIEGFGLLPAWRGRGLGAGLLTAAMRAAFATGATRVWLHTATDDHPHALPNYLARGFRIYREEPLRNPMPGKPEGGYAPG